MSGKIKDLTNQRFGNLIAISFAGKDKRGNARWFCRCDCGNYITLGAPALKADRHHSCLSCRNVSMWRHRDTHRESKTRLYSIYHNMKKRCEKENAVNYHRYGGNGISICDEWRSYEAFSSWAHSTGYSDDLTLDRIDGTKGYSPANCRWATYKEQALNTKKNHRILFNGEELTISEWADKLGISRSTLCERLNKRGWSIERALSTPVRGR